MLIFKRKTFRFVLSSVFVLAVSVFACSRKAKPVLVDPPQGRTLESFSLTASEAMVVAPNREASEIGAAVLKKGGNAADAAIAISFALSVLRPQSTGLGGGGFLLHHDAATGVNKALDFREFAPLASDRDMFLREGEEGENDSLNGALSVAVPRLAAGLGFVFEHYSSGKIPWGDLLQPAVNLAKGGFAVYPHLAKALEERKEILARFPSSAKIFLPGGQPLKEGDRLVQSDLARTLEILAQAGWPQFYRDEIALRIVAAVRENGGILSSEDFQYVAARELEPVESGYRGFRVVTMPLPSSGGIVLAETLNILENFPLRRRGPHHAKTIHLVAETMKRAFLDRAVFLGDPRFVKVPVRGLLSKEYARSLAEGISVKKASPSRDLSPVQWDQPVSESTTHFSIVDAQGNAVSSTQTINYFFGSGLVAEGTGIVLNDEMDDFSTQPGVPNVFGLVGNEANAIQPGKIPLSSMTPTFVFDKEGNLEMVVGSPGGPKIITAVLQTILNRITFRLSPLEAVAAKRYHHQWLPDRIFAEPGLFNRFSGKRLALLGHSTEDLSNAGLVMLIARTPQGWVGVADPRGVGVPSGF